MYTYYISAEKMEYEGGSSTDFKGESAGSSSETKDNVYDVNIVENTFSVTNTYNSKKSNLNIEKYLYLEMNNNAPIAYPAITFNVTRTYNKNDGVTLEKESVKNIVWTSADVKKAYTDQGKPTDGLVSETFTISNLPVYAPNGSKYTYTVEEVKTNLNGYDTWAVKEDINSGNLSTYMTDVNKKTSLSFELTESSDNTVEITYASFINKLQESTMKTVVITGSKFWNDWDDSLGLRPTPDNFAKNSLSLWRNGRAQGGTGGSAATGDIKLDSSMYTIKWYTDNTYTEEVTDDNYKLCDTWYYKIE